MLNETHRSPRPNPAGPRRNAGHRRRTPLRARLREATRAAILDAAERVFAREGTRHGRMEQVAARAGVSVGTLYNYFQDRRALVDALIASRRAVLLRSLDATLASPEDDFRRQVTAVVATIEGHVRTHRGFLAMLVREGLLVVDRPVGSTDAPLMQRVESLMRRGLRRRAVSGSSATELATVLLAITRAALLRRLSSRAPGPPDARRIARLFFDGAGNR